MLMSMIVFQAALPVHPVGCWGCVWGGQVKRLEQVRVGLKEGRDTVKGFRAALEVGLWKQVKASTESGTRLAAGAQNNQ